jgi:hypothetical protein
MFFLQKTNLLSENKKKNNFVKEIRYGMEEKKQQLKLNGDKTSRNNN